MNKLDSYDAIVDSWGYETLLFKCCGSYQGDYVVLLRDGNRYGFTTIGYGSCSGCDALEALSPYCYGDWSEHQAGNCECDWSKVQSFADGLREDIKWGSASYLLEELGDDKLETQWYFYDSDIKKAIQEIRGILSE